MSASQLLAGVRILALVWACSASALAAPNPAVAPRALLPGHDWPRFLGPAGDGHSEETDLTDALIADDAREQWHIETGPSFASPSVVGDTLVDFHRNADDEVVDARDAVNGFPRWRFAYPAPYTDSYGTGDGPRATPAIADGRVFTLGVTGVLHALDLATGKKLWSRDLKSEFRPDQRDLFFGIGMTPLVEGDRLLVGIGGARAGAGIVALSCADGKTLWQATREGPSYSTPVCATIGGKRLAFFLTRAGAVCLDPANGAVRWSIPFRSRVGASVNAASPVVTGDRVFFSAAYDVGALLVDASGATPRTVWQGDAMSNHFGTCHSVDGFLYGFDGRFDSADTNLRCVELATGRVLWTTTRPGKGAMIRAGGLFWILGEGALILAQLTPGGYRERGRVQVLSPPTLTPPVLSRGRLFVRNERRLICLDVRRGR